MEKAKPIKEEILVLITYNFGSLFAKTFLEAYEQTTLPIYTQAAQQLLEGLLGTEKTKIQLLSIYKHHSVEQWYV